MFDEYEEIKRLFKENKDVKYVSLTYVDDYKTLMQSFMIRKKDFTESEGKVLNYWLSQVNPNLKKLQDITTYKEGQIAIKTNYYDDVGNVIRTFYYKRGKMCK